MSSSYSTSNSSNLTFNSIDEICAAIDSTTSNGQVPSVSSVADTFCSVTSAQAAASDAALNSNIPTTLNEKGGVSYAKLSSDYLEFSDILSKFVANMLELSQNSINVVVPKAKGKPQERKGQSKRDNDFTNNLPLIIKMTVRTHCDELFRMIMSCVDTNKQAIMVTMFAKIIMRERAITGPNRANFGKGNRAISFYIFTLFYEKFKTEALELVHLFVDYGCYNDINHLLGHYYGKDESIVKILSDVMVNALNNDIKIVSKTTSNPNGKGLPYYGDLENGEARFTHSQLKEAFSKWSKSLNHDVAINKLSYADILEKYPFVKASPLSLVSKFMKRQGKHNSEFRNYLVHEMLTLGGWNAYNKQITDANQIVDASKRKIELASLYRYNNFCDMTIRHIISTLSYLTGVVESWMCRNNWNINTKITPSGAINKYRRAYLNELDGEMLAPYQNETGNRSTEPTRIALRSQILKNALDGALKGAAMDSSKFWDAIKDRYKNVSHSEKLVLHAQFINLIEYYSTTIQSIYDQQLTDWKDSGSSLDDEPLNPFYMIATIDVSGSMGNEMGYAVVNGIILAYLSLFGKWFITFDNKPQLISIKGINIVDDICQVMTSPWGGSTNIDAAFNLLLELMKTVRTTNPTFNGKCIHVINTDGQFDPYFAGFKSGQSRHSYFYSLATPEETSALWAPFADRMNKRFAAEGFHLPLTVFWNYRSTGTYCASADFQGVLLKEGLTSSSLLEIFGQKITYKEDAGTGKQVADTSPGMNFLKVLADTSFDPVSDAIYRTNGLFGDSDIVANCKEFWAQYAPQSITEATTE